MSLVDSHQESTKPEAEDAGPSGPEVQYQHLNATTIPCGSLVTGSEVNPTKCPEDTGVGHSDSEQEAGTRTEIPKPAMGNQAVQHREVETGRHICPIDQRTASNTPHALQTSCGVDETNTGPKQLETEQAPLPPPSLAQTAGPSSRNPRPLQPSPPAPLQMSCISHETNTRSNEAATKRAAVCHFSFPPIAGPGSRNPPLLQSSRGQHCPGCIELATLPAQTTRINNKGAVRGEGVPAGAGYHVGQSHVWAGVTASGCAPEGRVVKLRCRDAMQSLRIQALASPPGLPTPATNQELSSQSSGHRLQQCSQQARPRSAGAGPGPACL
ncbi:hypothetical protein HOY80DRAFT_1045878 [Tuber brumale]|nr:hypothetical protein HOY80DRAFT_1045878 [Tuber brumale]